MRFASVAVLKTLTPVALPPGLLKLDTKPSRTGSPAVVKMIGIFNGNDLTMLSAPPVATKTAIG
jgi:hypothetical protein